MRILKFGTFPLVMLSAACASNVPVENAPPEPARTASAAAVTVATRWTATLNPVQERTAEIRQTTTNRARGSFTMTLGDSPGWSRFTLNFSANSPAGGNTSASWAIVPGACGSDEAPVLPISAFPMLALSGGGTAQIASQIHFEFPLMGSFHVNVYRADGIMNAESRSVAAVLACGNMKLQQ